VVILLYQTQKYSKYLHHRL